MLQSSNGSKSSRLGAIYTPWPRAQTMSCDFVFPYYLLRTIFRLCLYTLSSIMLNVKPPRHGA